MSLLIKGLDMPKLDENEEHLWVPGWIEVGKDGKAIFCTGTHFDPNTIHSYAVEEVPTHGRLIDADRLLALVEKEVNNTCIGCEPEPDDCCAYDRFEKIISEIKTAQTIIEAEGVNE